MSKLSMEDYPITNPITNPNTDNKFNTFNFMDDDLTKDLFINNLDIYNPKERYLELGIPNIYCSKYFDDEDFIYTRLKIKQSDSEQGNELGNESGDSEIDYNVINYITTHHISINFSENTLDTHNIYAKVLYLYQFVNSYYYSSLRNMRPIERIKYMPGDLLIWIDNIVGTMRYILDNDLFNVPTEPEKHDTKIGKEYFNELIYGLNLTVCHLKMLLNHYRISGIPIYNMEEKHIKKMFQVLNNMCVIIIYLKNVL